MNTVNFNDCMRNIVSTTSWHSYRNVPVEVKKEQKLDHLNQLHNHLYSQDFDDDD